MAAALEAWRHFCVSDIRDGALAAPDTRARGYLGMAYILIVDSQAASHQQLVLLMEQIGHRATAVATIAEANRVLHEGAPDLLASDVTLTDGSSAGLVRQAVGLGAKTLMMTGNPERIVEFDGAGQPYLSKPFPPELFVQRIEEILAGGNAA
jgi:DNA-binding response OmpR family regulator